jgi:hypothetical protein
MTAPPADETLTSSVKTAMAVASANRSPAETAGNGMLACAIRNVATDTKELVRYAGGAVLKAITVMEPPAGKTCISSRRLLMDAAQAHHRKVAVWERIMTQDFATRHANMIFTA